MTIFYNPNSLVLEHITLRGRLYTDLWNFKTESTKDPIPFSTFVKNSGLKSLKISEFQNKSVEINLDDNPIIESLSIEDFPNLETIDIVSLISQTRGIISNRTLKHLTLSHTKISQFPNLEFLVNLKVLNLQQNPELKSIPKEIASLTQLYHLDISETQISYIPVEIKRCTNLQIFKCDLARKLKNLEPLYCCDLRILSANSTILNHRINLSKWPSLQTLSMTHSEYLCDQNGESEMYALSHFHVPSSLSTDKNISSDSPNTILFSKPKDQVRCDTTTDATIGYGELSRHNHIKHIQSSNISTLHLANFKHPTGIMRSFLRESDESLNIENLGIPGDINTDAPQLIDSNVPEHQNPNIQNIRLSPSKSYPISILGTMKENPFRNLLLFKSLLNLSITFPTWKDSCCFEQILQNSHTRKITGDNFAFQRLESLSLSGKIKTGPELACLSSLKSLSLGPGILARNSEAFSDIVKLTNLTSFVIKHISHITLPDCFEECPKLKRFLCCHVPCDSFPNSIFRSKTVETVVFDVESDISIEIPETFPPPALQVFVTGKTTKIHSRNAKYSFLSWKRHWKR